MEEHNKNNASKLKVNLKKKVKSLYIIKHIFSFLYQNKKLSLIAYNKYFKNIFNLDIDYYKEISRKYKIVEKNGKGKEYKLGTNKLIFEGEYVNRKKNGKGKEYYLTGNLKFEGEYLNGKKRKGIGYNNDGIKILEIDNGKGKEYYDKDKIKFEGEFFDDRIWNGKIYNYNGNEVFELKYGNGYIKEFNNEGKLIFEGEYKNGQRNGKGKEYFINTKIIFNKNIYYNPIINRGEDNYFSQFSPFPTYSRYSQIPRFSVLSCFYNPNLDYKYIGIREDIDKLKFEGEYFIGKRWNGIGYNYYGNKEYEIKDGKGFVKEYNNNGKLIYEGEYLYGEKNGKGKEYNDNGELIFEGEYLYGEKMEQEK